MLQQPGDCSRLQPRVSGLQHRGLQMHCTWCCSVEVETVPCAAVAGGMITTHARIIFRICSVFMTIICNEQPCPHHRTTAPPARWIKTCLTPGVADRVHTGSMGHIPTSLQQQHTASTTATAPQQGHVMADHHQHHSLWWGC